MTRGIYIIANDKVIDNAIALLNSIRLYDREVPIFMIPFNEQYHQVASVLQAKHQVKLFPDLSFVEQFTQKIAEIFERDFLALPNKMRKLVQWFGPLDEFLYLDTDIIVFEKIAQVLDYLEDYEFINCDYHFKGRKLLDIFSPVVREKQIFTEPELQDVFNSGFWASKKGIFSQAELYKLLEECANHREYFDFSQKTTDQPILNYIILKSTTKRLNLVKISDRETGSWAGSSHFREQDRVLYDGDKRLRYLHWAGIKIESGYPYWEIWKYYRYLNEPLPPQLSPLGGNKWQKFFTKLRTKISNFR